MRLIDADKLVFTTCGSEWCNQNKSYCNTCPSAITTRNRIENAPTVEPCYQTTSCLGCKNYDKENYYCPRFCEVIREATEEIKRPQGEWITTPEYNFNEKCSVCGELNCWKRTNYCPNCGAKMIKGGAE